MRFSDGGETCDRHRCSFPQSNEGLALDFKLFLQFTVAVLQLFELFACFRLLLLRPFPLFLFPIEPTLDILQRI